MAERETDRQTEREAFIGYSALCERERGERWSLERAFIGFSALSACRTLLACSKYVS